MHTLFLFVPHHSRAPCLRTPSQFESFLILSGRTASTENFETLPSLNSLLFIHHVWKILSHGQRGNKRFATLQRRAPSPHPLVILSLEMHPARLSPESLRCQMATTTNPPRTARQWPTLTASMVETLRIRKSTPMTAQLRDQARRQFII